MLGLSHSFGYAVKALICLAGGNCRTTFVKDIAACTGVPPAYLSKVFTRLAAAGIIEAKRGWRGGNRLVAEPSRISLHEIAVALEGDRWVAMCPLDQHTCSDAHGCPLHAFWSEERARLVARMRETTLADIINPPGARGRTAPKRRKSNKISRQPCSPLKGTTA